jgi:soluble lytic murein transglycosylase
MLLDNAEQWNRYSDEHSTDSFEQIALFILDHPSYPNTHNLRKCAENSLKRSTQTNIKVIRKFFEKYPPLTPQGAKVWLRYIDPSQKVKAVRYFFFNLTFLKSERQEWLEEFSNILDINILKDCVESLLAHKKLSAVDDLVSLCPTLKSFTQSKRLLLSGIDQGQSHDSFEYVSYLVKKEEDDEASRIVDQIARKRDHEKLFPVPWARLRHILARNLTYSKKFKSAHQILSKHQLRPIKDQLISYADIELLLAFLEIRFLNQPTLGIRRLLRLWKHVKTPFTKSRVSFWIYKGYLKLNHRDDAIQWLKECKNYPITYHGQRALNLLKENKIYIYDPVITKSDIETFEQLDFVRILKNFDSPTQNFTMAFLLALSQQKLKESHRMLLMKLANDMIGMHATVILSKQMFFHVPTIFSYPILPMMDSVVEKLKLDHDYSALAHGIIRQESNFQADAKSSKDAMGLMQLIPSTARQEEDYLKKRGIMVPKGPVYNVKKNLMLGLSHIQRILKTERMVMALCHYNAGPIAEKWGKYFGDFDDDTFIELITYGETRDYVQKVMGNYWIYKYMFRNPKRLKFK